MWCLLGHSNAEGFAGSSPMQAAAKHLYDAYAAYGYPNFNTASSSPVMRSSVYKNLLIWTAKAGFSDALAAPPSFSPGAGTFLPITVLHSGSPNQAYPHDSPYNYPNTRTVPVSPPLYQSVTTGGGTWVGAEIPVSWALAEYWAQPVYLQKLAIPASAFLRYDQGLNPANLTGYGVPDLGLQNTKYAWWTPSQVFDWSISTGRFYDVWKSRMAGAKLETEAAGDKLDTRLVVLWMGDNDASAASLTGAYSGDRLRYFEQDYRAFIRQVRKDLEDNDWTQIPGHQVPIILMGIYSYGSLAVRAAMNAAMQNIARDDPFVRFISTTAYESLTTAGYADSGAVFIGMGSHFSHNAYLQAARDIMDALVDMDTEVNDALGDEDRITVAGLRERVRIYYERGRTRTDAQDGTIDTHINAAVMHVINRVGDQAWWLRRIIDIAFTSGAGVAQTLPRHVHRVLRIERAEDPGYPLYFELQGATEGGRLQILMKEGGVGTYRCHIITKTRDIHGGEQWIPLPHNLIEWVTVETCRRLARASGNTTLQGSLGAEANELAADAMRNIAAMQRARHDRMHGQRRLPTRRFMGRWSSGWYWQGS